MTILQNVNFLPVDYFYYGDTGEWLYYETRASDQFFFL